MPVTLLSFKVMLSEKLGDNGNIFPEARRVHSRQSLGETLQPYLYDLKVWSERYLPLLESSNM